MELGGGALGTLRNGSQNHYETLSVLLTRMIANIAFVPLELPAGRGLRTLGPIIDAPFEDPG